MRQRKKVEKLKASEMTLGSPANGKIGIEMTTARIIIPKKINIKRSHKTKKERLYQTGDL